MLEISLKKLENSQQHNYAHEILRKNLLNLGIDYKNAVIEKGKYGKPYLKEYPDIHYNISHSNGITACYVCEIMLDTTGDGLHKRGYRRNAMEAPIRETLAATIADLGRVRRDSLVEDPFCGSGTLLIEAAQKAMNIAPGLKRRFAAERYSFVPAALWAEQRQKALAESKLDVGFEAFGYDIDPAAVALANANAKLAGVEKRCHFEVADVADFAAKQEAIVLTNPPYGERMSTIEGAAKLARTLGRQMEAHPCAGVYAITADMDFETHYGKRANKRRKMYNGMIPCQLYMYYNAPKFEHTAKPMPKNGFDGKRTAPNRFEKK